jgi:NADH:ubiquinone oxidoreductase subunit 6 (subunit J)
VNVRSLLVAVTLGVFLVFLSLFFVGVPWSSELHEVPIYSPTGPGVANDLFTTYAITLILIALLLSSAMIGGVYLAKMEGKR